MTHLDHLLVSFPNILRKPVLDIGAGKGTFMIDVIKRGGNAIGVEFNAQNVERAKAKAEEQGIKLAIAQGEGERLPYADSSFGFVNLCEVIEHVSDPEKVLEEAYRVLMPGGEVYMSVPNRYGLRDQHFHLYFVNWMPRSSTDRYISLFGRHKDYSGQSGHQKLSDMHYYTFGQIRDLASSVGFFVSDIREQKIMSKFGRAPGYFVLALYRVLRVFLFDSFHLKLKKN